MAILERAKQELTSGGHTLPPTDRLVLREAVFMLLERADRSMRLIELLTMVGLADHVGVAKRGSPISGDDFILLPNGLAPIGLTLELIQAADTGRLWEGRVSVTDGYACLVGSGECRKLSRNVRAILNGAFEAVHIKAFAEVIETLAVQCPAITTEGGVAFSVVPLEVAFVSMGASPADARDQVTDLRSYYPRSNEQSA